MKVPLFTKSLLKKTGVFVLGLLTIVSTIIPLLNLYWWINLIILLVILVFAIPVHIYFWKQANKISSITLKINNSDLIIEFGDIFKEEDNKIIPFNEYFDTSLDDILVTRGSLHGQYLKRLPSVETLDKEIANISEEKIVEQNTNRRLGKKTKYKLGTILPRQKYFLLAFSHFDDDNRANLTQNEYVDCLLNMWAEIDKIYNQKTVCIPLLGGGITRFKDGEVSNHELLSIMIWSFRISKVKFAYPSKVKIVLYSEESDKINLYEIKEKN